MPLRTPQRTAAERSPSSRHENPAQANASPAAPTLREARNLGNDHVRSLDFRTCGPGGCGKGDEEVQTAADCPMASLLETCSGGCGGCARQAETGNAPTLTPDEDASGEFVTLVTGELQTQDAGAPVPAAGTHCSPTSAKFTDIPSGKLTPTFGSGMFGRRFNMKAEFETPIPCTCVSGEYRQFVRGYAKHNGTAVVHPLCSNTLDPATWHEDCMTSGGVDLKYGYHSIPFPTSKFTNPDQATGCNFVGIDHPGFPLSGLSKGDTLELHLEFQGKLVDASDGDRVLKSSSWSVEGTGTVP
ncbi:hypothetical protein JOF56_006927 [Kibdelosporangium banguiense]|uniref:Uncharacterized protein n=1 Tax=Kibdelosporangium banguiense TaxID=1365924 RepID=A0ABS4TQ56_9PSEU|nr:hypothetical protein [Kibdelosporangium banguiense]MBP2326542.1 hypothetical protein [Kibdelosporangium banguiense]